MTNEQIAQKIASMEKAINNPNIPDSVREKMKKSVEELKSQVQKAEEKAEVQEEKIEKEEEKVHSQAEETIARLKKAIDNPSIPEGVREKMKAKLKAAEEEIASQKKEIKEEKKEAQEERKEVKKAVDKLEKVAKKVAKKRVVKGEKAPAPTPKVKVKKVKIKDKERAKKRVKRKIKIKKIVGELASLIRKNKRLKSAYKGSDGNLKKDAARSGKPIGYRFKGKNDYRKPTSEQIEKGLKRGTVYKEARPNRGDVFPKGYSGSIRGLRNKKLEDGGMTSDEFKKSIEQGDIIAKHQDVTFVYANGTLYEMSIKPQLKITELGSFKSKKEASDWLMSSSNLKEMGFEMAKGGIFQSPQKAAANRGAAWTLDHNQHNKKESYEKPMNKRKRKRY